MRLSFLMSLLVLITISPASMVQAEDLRVDRIEPPSWWSSADAPQELTLLVEGAGLQGARVSSRSPSLQVRQVVCPGEGGSLLIDVVVPAGARPEPLQLHFERAGEVVHLGWRLEPEPAYKPDPVGPDDIIYLVMPDRFANGEPGNDRAEMQEEMFDRAYPNAYHGGDFKGLEAKLPYLADLGVTALWLTPVVKTPPTWFVPTNDSKPATQKYAEFHGYATFDHFDTNPRFGTQAEYLSLVRAAHRLGIKVIQDQALGHTSPQHRWVKAPPTADWFHGPIEKPPVCNFRFDALANPHARALDRRDLTDGWFFGILPDLNTQDDTVKRYAIQHSLWWARKFEADGIRLDTYPMIDRSFWRDWSRERAQRAPGLWVAGEAWTSDAGDLSFFQGGRPGWDGIDPAVESVFDFPLNSALQEVLVGKAPAARLGKALSRDFLYPQPDALVTFLDNHDMPRLAALPEITPARYRLAAAFLLTSRGVPQLTWGNEIGLLGHGDDRRDFLGGWPGDARDAFTQAGRTPQEQTTFELFRDLTQLRKKFPALRRGATTEVAATDQAFAYIRQGVGDSLLIVLNFGKEPVKLALSGEISGPGRTFRRVWGEGEIRSDEPSSAAEIPAEQVAIFVVE